MVEAATNAQIKEIFERNERTVRSDRRKKTVGKAELWVTELDALLERIRTAEADKARLSEALRTFESYGCPVCGGDCASANPPVMFCPMQAARVALSGSGPRWWLIPNGEPVTLDDCPEGLFLFNGYLGFMTEYATDKNDGFRQRDAYCVDSGEYFWGGTSNARERAKLIVQPMLPAAPQQGGE